MMTNFEHKDPSPVRPLMEQTSQREPMGWLRKSSGLVTSGKVSTSQSHLGGGWTNPIWKKEYIYIIYISQIGSFPQIGMKIPRIFELPSRRHREFMEISMERYKVILKAKMDFVWWNCMGIQWISDLGWWNCMEIHGFGSMKKHNLFMGIFPSPGSVSPPTFTAGFWCDCSKLL